MKERWLTLFEHRDVDSEALRTFNALCLSEYIAVERGKAALTTIPPRHARSGKLLRQFPRAKRVIVVPPPFWWEANR
jgi:hypothetical protein